MMTARTHYSNLMFKWCSRRGQPALMRPFLPSETSGSELFSASLFTPAPHTRGRRAYVHARGWVARTTASNERCDKEKQVSVNCRKPSAKPVQTWLLSEQSHALRAMCKGKKTHLVQRQWIKYTSKSLVLEVRRGLFFQLSLSLLWVHRFWTWSCRLNMFLTKQPGFGADWWKSRVEIRF